MISYRTARGFWSVVFLVVGTVLMVLAHGWANTGLALVVNFGTAALISAIPLMREGHGWKNQTAYFVGSWMMAWGLFALSPYSVAEESGFSPMRVVVLAATLGSLSLISFLTSKAFDFKPVTQ